MNRLTFTRRTDGTFNLSEPALTRMTAELRPRVGQQGPLLPTTLMGAVCTELVRCSHEIADRRQLPFHEAARRVVCERPELFWLSRGVAVADGDATADVEVDE